MQTRKYDVFGDVKENNTENLVAFYDQTVSFFEKINEEKVHQSDSRKLEEIIKKQIKKVDVIREYKRLMELINNIGTEITDKDVLRKLNTIKAALLNTLKQEREFLTSLQSKINRLDKEVTRLEKEVKSHKQNSIIYRFFHYPINSYRKREYSLKGAKWAFLTALSLYIKNENNEELLLNNYRTLIRAGGEESETGALLKTALALEKLPAKVVEKFYSIRKEEGDKYLEEEGMISKSSPKKS